MKKIFLGLLFFCASAAFIYGQHEEVSYSNENNSFNLKVTNSSEKLKLTIKGDIKLGDDDKTIAGISQGGFLLYKKKDQSVEVENGSGADLEYTINGNKKTVLTEADKAVVANCVQLLISYGIDADNRVKRIFAQKGVNGVLDEVSHFKSDYVKEIYLSYLLKNKKLTKDEMIALLTKTDQYLNSDYYKAELLDGVMASFLADPATSDAYLKAVSNIKSDYYQSTTVKKILNTSLSEKQFGQVLMVVDNMNADYYQAEVLKMLLKNNDIPDARFSNIMKTAGSIKSDYYKAEIISALLKDRSLNKDRYAQTIAAMQNMKSSYYQYTILTKLVDEQIKEETAWSQLIQYATKLDSEYYQAEMLMKIAGKMPYSETLRKELGDAAKNIKSDHYYGMVMRSLDKRA